MQRTKHKELSTCDENFSHHITQIFREPAVHLNTSGYRVNFLLARLIAETVLMRVLADALFRRRVRVASLRARAAAEKFFVNRKW